MVMQPVSRHASGKFYHGIHHGEVTQVLLVFFHPFRNELITVLHARNSVDVQLDVVAIGLEQVTFLVELLHR